MNVEWKKEYNYWILLIATILTFLFLRVEAPVPIYPAGLFILLMSLLAFDMSWEKWKKDGRACILNLEIKNGGHTSIHPYDVRPATQYYKEGKKLRSFMVFATGGFMITGFNIQGSDQFIVCPPEHIEETPSAMICHTELRKVRFERMPDYVQNELVHLTHFKLKKVRQKDNLYFGMCSKIDGTLTEENKIEETKFLDKNEEISTLQNIISDLHEQLHKRTDIIATTVGEIIKSKEKA